MGKLSTDAKIMAGSIFGFNSTPRGTELVIGNQENRLTSRSRKALEELIAAGFVVREKSKRKGEERFRSLPQCTMYRKFAARASEAKGFYITEPIFPTPPKESE